MLYEVEYDWEKDFNECLRAIENAEECVKSKEIVEEEVLGSLNSLKNFLISEKIFWSIGTGTKLRDTLNHSLAFFTKRKKYIRFKEWNPYYQKVLSIMKTKVITDDDWDSIQKIRAYLESRPINVPYTFEKICSDIYYEILKLKIESRYADEYYIPGFKNKIALYEFVERKVKSFGNSDSYMAQLYYKKVLFDLYDVSEYHSYSVKKLLLDLEICRCMVKESKNSEEELLKEYDFSFCGMKVSELKNFDY